jgi:hypothetical protein
MDQGFLSFSSRAVARSQSAEETNEEVAQLNASEIGITGKEIFCCGGIVVVKEIRSQDVI